MQKFGFLFVYMLYNTTVPFVGDVLKLNMQQGRNAEAEAAVGVVAAAAVDASVVVVAAVVVAAVVAHLTMTSVTSVVCGAITPETAPTIQGADVLAPGKLHKV